MHPQINMMRATRTWLLNIIKDLSVEQLNEVPAGFNNNIIWNVGHLIAAQQGVCYVRAGLKPVVEEKYFLNYKTDTKPGDPLGEEEINTIKQLLHSTLDQLESDLDKNIFSNYTEWATRSGLEMKHIDDALSFLPFHEGLHVGYVMALKRIITG
ncbi:MAG: DinB family protein [Ferruginibacter sp.]